MKCFVSFACALSVFVAVSLAAPLPQSDDSSSGVSTGVQASGNILGNLDIPGLLRSASQLIGVIRQFCPELGQIIDNVVQSVTSQVFRVVGRAILQNGGLTGNSGSGEARKVNVVLPTFPPDDDEDYDDDDEEETSNDVDLRIASSTNSSNADANSLSAASSNSNSAAVNTTTLYTSAVNDDNNSVDRQVRRVRAAEDQDVAASGGNKAPLPAEDLSNVEVEDADRNKRYLPFGGGDAHASGGSGNFLFDIIRNTADRAARAAGTVYRMIAGTENLGAGLTATVTTTKTVAPAASPSPQPQVKKAQLIAGSGATEESDEKEHAGGVAEIDVAKGGDGYTEGIPGPITRLFVIANRGLANLVQDLILRLAQTSERIVNFKARLVTSLI